MANITSSYDYSADGHDRLWDIVDSYDEFPDQFPGFFTGSVFVHRDGRRVFIIDCPIDLETVVDQYLRR